MLQHVAEVAEPSAGTGGLRYFLELSDLGFGTVVGCGMSDEIEELRRQLACKEAAIKALKKWRKAVADQLGLKARSKPNGACEAILDLQNKVRNSWRRLP